MATTLSNDVQEIISALLRAEQLAKCAADRAEREQGDSGLVYRLPSNTVGGIHVAIIDATNACYDLQGRTRTIER
jgi:hypothetical protein